MRAENLRNANGDASLKAHGAYAGTRDASGDALTNGEATTDMMGMEAIAADFPHGRLMAERIMELQARAALYRRLAISIHDVEAALAAGRCVGELEDEAARLAAKAAAR